MLSKEKFGWYIQLTLVLLLALAITGCSEGNPGGPLTPSPEFKNQNGIENAPQRVLWGYWIGYIPETHDSLELIPVRNAAMHLNARRLLESDDCDSCLTILDLEIDPDADTLMAEIQITHPYPGLDRFTGFNVRAVVISDGSMYFPELDARVPNPNLGDFTCGGSGYTRMWNSVDFPEGSGAFPMLEYSQGKFASPGSFTGTVNPFTSFNNDDYERNILAAGSSESRHFYFDLISGGIKFGYAVDASWQLPTVDPPVNVLTDFPASANCLEAVTDSYWPAGHIDETQGAVSEITYPLKDFQGWETVSTAVLECPDLWTGTISYSSIELVEELTYYDTFEISFELTNEFGTDPGEYYGMLKVQDIGQDPWLGDINDLYMIVPIVVHEVVEPEFTGEMVYLAPGPDDPMGPGAQNVFHYDFDTGIETQLTNFMGVGYLFHGPRINAQGTHHLHCAGPTPYYGNVRVYEFGGSDWSITTDEVDDYADFHPDGLHILTASGDEWGNTPDLYVMEYDGSNRTLLTTASESIMNPKYSPDGDRIAMTLGMTYGDPPSSELWIYDIDGDTWTEILPANGTDNNPSWSPVKPWGHDLLIFDSSRNNYPDYDSDIFIINPDTQEILFVMDTGESEQHPSFSPDGLSFVFSMIDDDTGDTELYVCEWQNGGAITAITDDETYDNTPSWGWGW